MTSNRTAEIAWQALDREGRDKCRLVQEDGGWMLIGHARFRADGMDCALDYVVRVDADWMTRSADVSGLCGRDEMATRIERGEGGWTRDGVPQPQVNGATDIDLGFTPATNLMPLRRLPEIGQIEARAAWLPSPGAGLEPLDQTYRRARGGLVHYAAAQTGTAVDLKVDGEGFVTLYPGFWEGRRTG
jgi:hypothetical protein